MTSVRYDERLKHLALVRLDKRRDGSGLTDINYNSYIWIWWGWQKRTLQEVFTTSSRLDVRM